MRWGPLPDLRGVWFAYTVTSGEQTRTGSETRPYAVLTPGPAWSGISPWTCQALVDLPHSPKVGHTVGRDEVIILVIISSRLGVKA